jgi:hypothetical protein
MAHKFIDMHDRLYNRLRRATGLVAIFLDAGTLRTTPATEKALNKVTASRNLKLLGVYTKDCTSDWLYDDLRWADKNWSPA